MSDTLFYFQCLLNGVYYFDKLLGGGEAADTERQQDPSTRVAAFRWILGQLLANLTVNFIPDRKIQAKSGLRHPVVKKHPPVQWYDQRNYRQHKLRGEH